jgi:hypothetical protein
MWNVAASPSAGGRTILTWTFLIVGKPGLHACACGKSVLYMTVTTSSENVAHARSRRLVSLGLSTGVGSLQSNYGTYIWGH